MKPVKACNIRLLRHLHTTLAPSQLKKNVVYRPHFEFDLRKDARDIFLSALKAVSPNKLVEKALQLDKNNVLRLPDGTQLQLKNNVYVAAFGLSAIPMARGAEDALGGCVAKGYVSSPTGISENLRLLNKDEWVLSPISRLQVCEGASQKRMDKNAEDACKRIMSMCSMLDKSDVLLVLISGGGERLLPAPLPHVLSLQEKQHISNRLYSKGATNAEVMSVVKHLSQVKGGRLAKLAAPATVVMFAISNMLENCLDLIAGGPTVPMYDTAHAALAVLNKYELRSEVSLKVLKHLEEQRDAEKRDDLSTTDDFDSFLMEFMRNSGSSANTDELLAPASISSGVSDLHERVENVHNFIVGDNEPVLAGAAKFAETRGYFSYLLSNKMRTESRQLGLYFANLANYMCEIFETRRTRYAINVEIGDYEFDLIERFGMHKKDITAINKLVAQAYNKSQPVCVCAGGELLSDSNKATYAINSEVALACAVELDRLKREKPDLFERYEILFLSCDSDGNDGTSPFAGALAYPELIENAKKFGVFGQMKLDLKESSEFYAHYRNAGDAVHTGLTGLSIMNIFLLLVKSKQGGAAML